VPGGVVALEGCGLYVVHEWFPAGRFGDCRTSLAAGSYGGLRTDYPPYGTPFRTGGEPGRRDLHPGAP
jgi:hypothetical protein